VPYRARTEAELGLWLAEQGRVDEAAPLLDSARAGYTALGASVWLERLEAQLASGAPRQSAQVTTA
jgi:hypothetical protein